MALGLRYPKRVYPRKPRSLPLARQYPIYALNFDGLLNRVTVPRAASIEPPVITITCWIKPGTGYGAGAPRIVDKDSGTGGYLALIFPASGKIQWLVRDLAGTPYSTVSINALPVNTLTPVALVYDGVNLLIYLNGVVDITSVVGGSLAAGTSDLYIGNNLWQARGLYGSMALLSMYDQVLSQAEIQRNIRNPLNPIRNGLVLFHPMIEGQGLSVADYSGQGNNGTLEGGVTWSELQKYELPAGAGL